MPIIYIKYALILSVVFQFIAAIIAISLIKKTKYNISWILISLGFYLMAIRRLFEFLDVMHSEEYLYKTMINSWIGVLISLIMLLGLIFIRQIFNLQKRIDDLRKKNEYRIFSAIIKTEENEKQKFAKELHDGLGPIIAGVKMAISTLVNKEQKPVTTDVIENTDKLIDEAIITIKEISNNLSPHILNNFGLLKAVKSFIDKLNYHENLNIIVNSNIENKRFNYNIEVVLYRVICELITNTLKHASANKLEIDLFYEDNKLKLDFFDDGIGFDVESTLNSHKGMGYSNILSRIKSLDGAIDIESKPDQGVTIRIIIVTE